MLGYPIVFRCCECTVEEPNLENLESHIWSRHFRKFPYNCSICDFPAINSSSLTDHFHLLHPEQPYANFKRNLDDEKRLRQMVAESIAVLVETQERPRVVTEQMLIPSGAPHYERIVEHSASDEDDFGLLEDDENVDEMIDDEEEYVDNLGNTIFMGDDFIDEEEDEHVGTGNSFHLKLLRQRRLEKTINDVASEGALSMPSTSRSINEIMQSADTSGTPTTSTKSAAKDKNARLRCEMCGKTFKWASKLNEHRRSHLGERPFKCEYCPAEFTQKGALNTHSRLHTGERPYICQWECGKTFVSASARKLHEKTHSGERSFACSICGKTFTKNSHCLRHVRNIHRVLTAENPYEDEPQMTLELTMNVEDVLTDEKFRLHNLVNDVIDSVREEKFIRNGDVDLKMNMICELEE